MHFIWIAFVITLFIASSSSSPSLEDKYSYFYCDEIGNGRSCSFENICYDSSNEYWLFFSSAEDEMTPFLKLGGYDSSDDMSFKVMKSSLENYVTQYEYIEIESQTVLYFSLSNLYFHWLLDDMFGLFWLMNHFEYIVDGRIIDGVGMVLSNTMMSSHHSLIPDLFPFNEISRLVDLKRKSSLICFNSLIAGPSSHHLGGPGAKNVKSSEIIEFRDYIMKHLFRNDKEKVEKEKGVITVVLRRESRLILNDKELIKSMRDYVGDNVEVSGVYLEEMSLHDQLALISKTTHFVCMHGSAMANIVFLPQNSKILEIFPYGFSRPTFRGLVMKLRNDLGLHYFEYTNPYLSGATFHSKYLDNLSPAQKKTILQAKEFNVNMGWAGNLYWINQDTTIDIESFMIAFKHIWSNTDTINSKREL